jgi:predicted O-methyltransferase YrrM
MVIVHPRCSDGPAYGKCRIQQDWPRMREALGAVRPHGARPRRRQAL